MSNYVNPMGEIQGGFTAPEQTGGKVKKDNIQLLPAGPNSGVIFCLVDLGSHMESFNGGAPELKRKVQVGFEHPQLKQLFYEDDTVQRSSCTWLESTFSLGDRAKLRKVIEAVTGKISDQEAYKYDLSRLLGARLLVNIVHKFGKKDPSKIYEVAESFLAHGQIPLPASFHPENEYLSFIIDKEGNNFRTMNFAKLPSFLKKKILASEEAKSYIAKGGQFAQLPKEDRSGGQPAHNQGQQQYAQNQQALPNTPPMPQAQGSRLVMLVNDFTYEQYLQSGWTDQMLIDNGKARLEAVAPAPAPVAPSAPSAPVAPSAPPQPQMAAAPIQNIQQPAQPIMGSANFADDDNDDVPF